MIKTLHHTIEARSDGTIFVAIIGDGDVEVAKQFVADAEKELGTLTVFPAHIIVDMRLSGLSDYEGIETYRAFLKDKRLGTLVFVVANQAVETLIKMAVRGREQKTLFVKTIEEAEGLLSLE